MQSIGRSTSLCNRNAGEGADVTGTQVTVLNKIKAIDKSIEVLELASPLSYSTAEVGTSPFTFNRSLNVTVTLNIHYVT